VNFLLFGILTLFWGFSFIAIKVSIETFPPFMAAGLRIFLAMVFLLIYTTIWKRKNTFNLKNTLYMFFLGILLFGIPWACLFWGEQFVHPSLASIINSCVPIFVLTLSWLLLPEEKPILPAIIGVMIGFIGMVCVFAPGLHGHTTTALETRGIIAVFIMSFSYALGNVFLRKAQKGLDMVWGLILQAFAGSIFLFVVSFLVGERVQGTTHITKSILGIVYLASCSTAIASLVYYQLLKEWGALKSSTVTYVTPFIAIAVDLIVLGVHPKPNEFLGGGLIMAGILLIHWTKTKGFHIFVRNLLVKKR
jgi:drug/metabolite transporter (DMT)-like permease